MKAPVEIVSNYLKHHLRAKINSDGSIVVGGRRHRSLSAAGGEARKPFYKGDLKGHSYPPTNGWTFWRVNDPETGSMITLDVFRDRYLDRKRDEARRFLRNA